MILLPAAKVFRPAIMLESGAIGLANRKSDECYDNEAHVHCYD